MSHRVKNSLASVVGLLRVQSRNTHSDEVRSALEDAGSRVQTIAEVHCKVITGLVRQLHGHLTVSSNKPKGAHFLFELPILPEPEQEPTKDPQHGVVSLSYLPRRSHQRPRS